MNTATKRLFFGLQVDAPWPKKLPKGRLVDPMHRHLTLAFLGNIDYAPLQELLPSCPAPDFSIGQVGSFRQCVFLPFQKPRVAAWEVEWLEDGAISTFQGKLAAWLREAGYELANHNFLPHVTIARSPFEKAAWSEAFHPLPMVSSHIHLYESVGDLQYVPIWSHPIPPPLESIGRNRYIIRGKDWKQLYLHGLTALSFTDPTLLASYDPSNEPKDLNGVLNILPPPLISKGEPREFGGTLQWKIEVLPLTPPP